MRNHKKRTVLVALIQLYLQECYFVVENKKEFVKPMQYYCCGNRMGNIAMLWLMPLFFFSNIFERNKVFRHSKRKLVICSKQTMRLSETDHVICFSQSHGLFTTKYKFWFTMLKHLMWLEWTGSTPVSLVRGLDALQLFTSSLETNKNRDVFESSLKIS